MIKILTLALLSALALTITNPAKAGTTEDLREARKEKKELCLLSPECKAKLDQKLEARNLKALEKVRKEIQELKKR